MPMKIRIIALVLHDLITLTATMCCISTAIFLLYLVILYITLDISHKNIFSPSLTLIQAFAVDLVNKTKTLLGLTSYSGK